MKLIIVTGLSGSGKSITLNTLEDMGYYCIDSVPLFLVTDFIEALIARGDPRFLRTAIGIDARNHTADREKLDSLLIQLKQQGANCEVLFLESENETLIKRYSETRRKHPLSDEQRPLAEAIQLERSILAPFLDTADLRVDTSHTTQHQLRDLVKSRVGAAHQAGISILFESFGFKHGVPRDSDFVYDARCLPNPYWEISLRPLTGRDSQVAAYLEQHENVLRFKRDIIDFMEQWIPCFRADGRSYLTVAIGCTGGQHRSVYLVEKLSAHFRSAEATVLTRHRELP